MILNDAMTKNPKTCHLEDSIQQVARTMTDNNIGFLPVVNDDGMLVGTITDRDITTRATAQGKGQDTTVREVYSDNPVHLNKYDALAQAEDLMMDAHIRRLIVVDEAKRPIGVLSEWDVARYEKNLQRRDRFFETVLEPRGRNVQELVGSACCG